MTTPKQVQRISLLLLMPLLILAPLLMPRAKAAPTDVTWGPMEVRDTTGLSNVYADVAYDANSKAHMAWVEYGATDSDASFIYYTNNVAGTWLPPHQVATDGGRDGSPTLAIAVVGSQVHIAYTNFQVENMVHIQVTLDGATPTNGAKTVLSGTAKGYGPGMTVAPNGDVHIAYTSNKQGDGIYRIYHLIWTGSAFSAERLVRNGDSLQKELRIAASSNGTVHMVFISNQGQVARYSFFDGTTWNNGPDIGTSRQKLQSVAAFGNTVVTAYSAQPVADGPHNVYMKIRNGGTWSAPVLLSSGTTYDENPDISFSPFNNKMYVVWNNGPTSTNIILSREIDPATGSAGPAKSLGGTKALWPRVEASVSSAIGVVWQDKAPVTVFNAVIAQGTVTGGTTTPTPTPTNTPLPNTVDFAATRTSPSPTNNLQIAITINGTTGSPNEMRFSTTPFLATDAAPAWGAMQTSFTATAPASVGATCGTAAVFMQLRNTTTSQASAVKALGAVIDNDIQAFPYMTNPNLRGQVLPDDVLRASQSANPYAPMAGADDFTRDRSYYYRFGDEIAGCAGLAAYRDSITVTQITTAQAFYANYGAASNFNSNSDPTGTGYPEQDFTATLVITDKLGTAKSYQRTIRYDDDPPVLLPGGSLTLVGGAGTTSGAVVTMVFSATVTDDGYNVRTPAGQNYWGAWVLAVDPAVTTDPKPSDFFAHGQPIPLAPGSATIPNIRLNNGLTGASPTGQRRVYVAFLDGAGNFSGYNGADSFNGTLLASPELTLTAPATQLRIFAPVLRRQWP